MRRVIVAQNLILFFDRFFEDYRLVLLDPFVRTQTVAQIRVDIFGLHHFERLPCAKIVALVTQANIFQDLEAQGFFVDFNAPGNTHHSAENVIIDQQGFRASSEQARVHPGAFVNNICPRDGSASGGISPFGTSLDIGKLGIGHTAGGTGWQVVIIAHLCAG